MTRKETPKPADTLASAAPLHSPQPAVVPQTTGTNRPGAELIARYFPDLTAVQQQRFTALEGLYREWNAKINVISRKDIGLLYLHHVLHSLVIAKVCSFSSGARILDVGCGGGFPGIPLAILFPEIHGRAEAVQGKFDFVVSRAVTEMKPFIGWIWDKIEPGNSAGTLANGILYLKGGDLEAELSATGRPYALYEIGELFDDRFFETKKVVYIPR